MPEIIVPVCLAVACFGIIMGKKAERDRDISNIIDDAMDAYGNEIQWNTTSTIDVKTNKFLEPYDIRSNSILS